MHVFMPFVANASRGGLHAHVDSLVRLLLSEGHDCTVMCRPCLLVQDMRSRGATVLETSYDDLSQSIHVAMDHGPYDLVHAHPYLSRQVGVAVAKQQQLPLMVTMHGMIQDNLPSWSRDVGMLVCVSTAVRDVMIAADKRVAARTVVVPNGVDTSVFWPGEESLDGLLSDFSDEGLTLPRPQGPVVLIVTRMHEDKLFILECVEELWSAHEAIGESGAVFWVAGEGEMEGRLRAKANALGHALGREAVGFLGWQPEEMLARLFRCASLAIAPGRSVLEAMSCETPVICIGSKVYGGLQKPEDMLLSAYTNFGGVGAKHDDYVPGQIIRDFQEGLTLSGDPSLREAYRGIIDWNYDQRKVDAQLAHVYALARLQPPAKPVLGTLAGAKEPPDSSTPGALEGVRVSILRASEYTTDGRARKQAAALADAGAHVTLIGVGKTVPQDLVEGGHTFRMVPPRPPAVMPRLGREDVLWPVRVAVNLSYTRMAERRRRARISRLAHPAEDAIVAAVTESNADIIHAYNIQTLPAAVRAKRKTGARVIYDSRDMYTDIDYVAESDRQKYAHAEAKLLPYVDEILVVSEPRADALESRYGIPRPTVIYNGPAEVMPCAESVHQPVRLLFQGALLADRNLQALISAMDTLRGRAVLSLQGFGGIESELRQQVVELGLEADVRFLPPALPLEVVRSASEHDVGIICHRGESLNHQTTVPNKLMDYLGAGLAVAASDLSGHRSVLEGSGAGVFLDPTSSETLAQGLGQLVDDSACLTEMKGAALETAERYRWTVQAEKLIRIYESLLPSGVESREGSAPKPRITSEP